MSGLSDSKYINNIEEKVFKAVSVIFIISAIVMPPYFGIPAPGFDLTAVRMLIIALMIMICAKRERLYDFLPMIKYNGVFLATAPYIFVITYTMVLRTDLKAFLNPFIEFLILFLAIYVIRSTLGVETTIKIIIGCYYLLAIEGIIEYFLGYSLFYYLKTLDGALTSGVFIRNGHYRIVGPAAHALGYGLMLNIALPLSCLDLKNNKFYMFQRPLLFFMLVINIVFTGSRSSFAVMGVEIIGIFLLSTKIEKKRTLITGAIAIIVIGVLLIALSGTSVGGYFMLQITGVIDELLGTNLSVNYGATLGTKTSSDYREYLWYVFRVNWLNPLLGLGRSRPFSTVINGVTLKSLDNHYIGEYVRYAYPGMFSILFFFGVMLFLMLKKIIKDKDAYTKAIFLGSLSYMIALYYVDSLGTLKYLYLFFALFIGYAPEMFVTRVKNKTSKYLKQTI